MSIPGNFPKVARGRNPMLVHGVTVRELATVIKAPNFEINATFQRTNFQSRKVYRLDGQTYNSTGTAPVGNCKVKLFYTATDVEAAEVESDASGNFSFYVGPNNQYYIVAYKAGSPDIAGTSVNTLASVET